jgi:hypothetical protein
MRILTHVVDTRGAPLDLATVEQACERCKHLADSMKYLQNLLPQIQVVQAEDAVNALVRSEDKKIRVQCGNSMRSCLE